MGRDIQAAVLRQSAGRSSIETVTLDTPRPSEILVELAGTGMCHTDQLFRSGSWPFPLPAVLGHEGAGIVVEMGAAVDTLTVGDHVVCSSASCGRCRACFSGRPNECTQGAHLNMMGARADGSPTMRGPRGDVHGNFVGQSSFASHALTEARFAIKVADDLPLALLGTLGCGVQTGAGAVLNVLAPGPSSSVGIWGAGAVGLAAVMAARASGCRTIVVVDPNPSRRALASELGATHTLDTGDDSVGLVQELSRGGLDGAVEASGAPGALRAAVESTHDSGTTVLVGVAPLGWEYTLTSMSLLAGRTITGCVMGRSNPQVFIPELIGLYRRGLLPLEKITETYALSDIDLAYEDASGGKVVKPVLLPVS